MPGYTPLFAEIVTSSIWNEEHTVRIVWITLMALADMDGNVQASVAGFAPVARVTISECEKAIQILSSPDKYSRSQDYEGRRIKPINGGWHLINHKKYRQKAKSRAEYFRKWREEKKKNQKEKNNTNPNLNSNSNSDTARYIAQQDATVTKFTKNQCIDAGITIGISEQQSEAFYTHYVGQGWVFGSGLPIIDLQAAMVRWRNNRYKFDSKKDGETIESQIKRIRGEENDKPRSG